MEDSNSQTDSEAGNKKAKIIFLLPLIIIALGDKSTTRK
jgi:hypothetical protein